MKKSSFCFAILLMQCLLTCLSTPTLLAQAALPEQPAQPAPPSTGKADSDGPHIFYRKNKAYIKQVVMEDTVAVAKIDSVEAKQKEGIKIQCHFPKNPHWDFNTRLKAKLKNEPTDYPKAEKILAISDIEGNFEALRRFLLSHKVIDDQYNWTFGNGHLVCVGDFVDRGVYVTECLWLIYDLEEKAKAAGGYVHFLIGNHEVLNMSNDFRYVQTKYMRNAELYKEP